MSEIDHIFASNSKRKSLPTPPASASANKQKKKKKNTAKPEIPSPDINPPTSSKKRPLPETIVDTSHKFSGPSKRYKGHQTHANDANPKPDKSAKTNPIVDSAFKDSKGTSNRKFITG
jgi:hypothetical protein